MSDFRASPGTDSPAEPTSLDKCSVHECGHGAAWHNLIVTEKHRRVLCMACVIRDQTMGYCFTDSRKGGYE